MKKTGFTLVELLAVIAILAIIVTITVPIVTNIFQTSSEKAFEDNAMSLSKADDNYYTSLNLESYTKLPLLVTFNNGKETNRYMNNASNTCETSSERIGRSNFLRISIYLIKRFVSVKLLTIVSLKIRSTGQE